MYEHPATLRVNEHPFRYNLLLLQLATVPLFPSLSQKGTSASAALAKAQSRTWGPAGSGTAGGLLAPGAFGQSAATGGSVSPHFAGSAFQLIGSSSAAAALSMPGQSTDSILLGRLLHEKETMVSIFKRQAVVLSLRGFPITDELLRIASDLS